MTRAANMANSNHPVPAEYRDDLATRAFTHKFRKIGNPYAFLNSIGIVPILEYIYKGNLLIDVAEQLNVSYTILANWVENEGHEEAVDEAQRISAEGYLAEGLRRLRTANNEFELKRAKEMVAHARFMASKKDKTQYGSTEQTGVDRAGVSYVFNIAGNVVTPAVLSAPATPSVENDPSIIEGQLAVPAFNMLGHLAQNFDDIFLKEDTPPPRKKPLTEAEQAELPLIGPFYEP